MLKDIKLSLNAQTFTGSDEVHCVATLIKRWYGEMPSRVLDKIPPEDITAAAESEEDAVGIVEQLPELEKTLLLWLVDLLVTVAEKEERNRMSPSNLGIFSAFVDNTHFCVKLL